MWTVQGRRKRCGNGEQEAASMELAFQEEFLLPSSVSVCLLRHFCEPCSHSKTPTAAKLNSFAPQFAENRVRLSQIQPYKQLLFRLHSSEEKNRKNLSHNIQMPVLKGSESAVWFSHLPSSCALEQLWRELLHRLLQVGRSHLCPGHLDVEIPCVSFNMHGGRRLDAIRLGFKQTGT